MSTSKGGSTRAAVRRRVPWWVLALLGAQLPVGLLIGRRWCVPCIVYFEVAQRIFGEGPLEDARPPRFANMVGVVVLVAALTYLPALALGPLAEGLI